MPTFLGHVPGGILHRPTTRTAIPAFAGHVISFLTCIAARPDRLLQRAVLRRRRRAALEELAHLGVRELMDIGMERVPEWMSRPCDPDADRRFLWTAKSSPF